jgi:hypothetical protein
MKLRLKSLRLAVTFTALIVMPFFLAQACGPDFGFDVFVRKLRPDQPEKFAQGQLGLLLPTYPRKDLIVAFRYLNGGTLTHTEQQAYEPTYTNPEPEVEAEWDRKYHDDGKASDPEDPFEGWTVQRGSYATLVPNPNAPKKRDPNQYEPVIDPYANCLADAYRTATDTLRARAKIWSEKSAELADWLRGQDTVFANCSARANLVPSAVPANAPALLRADRAYQVAAAHFYSSELSEAAAEFEAIGQDTNSPWHSIAPYLAARCMIRKGFSAPASIGQSDTASFDPATMKQAANLLSQQLKENKPGAPRQAIVTMLNFVRLRIDAPARLHEIATALSGPNPDPDYRQDLIDLTWYLDSHLDELPLREDTSDFNFPAAKGANGLPNLTTEQRAAGFSTTYKQFSEIRAVPLIDWLLTFQSPAEEASAHALAEWRKTHESYWLLASIAKAKATDPAAEDLIHAAATLKPDTPALESFTYHRLRLQIARGHAAEARAELDKLLPTLRASGRDSAANAYLGLRMYAASDLNDLLSYAPHKLLLRDSQAASAVGECLEVMKDPKRKYDCKDDKSSDQFSQDAAVFFNTQAPLSMLVESATSTLLPERLRQSVAMMAWTRAVLLHDDAAAAKLFPLLPAKLQQQAGPGTGFHPLVTLVRNPGLRPFLDEGIQRSYSYDFVESYRDNWWCANWQGGQYTAAISNQPAMMPGEQAAFLTASQRDEAAKQIDALKRQENANLYLGEQVLAYARDHGDDPEAAESLYLVLRMIRYACDSYSYDDSAAGKAHNARVDALRKSAARLLRQRYTSSPWTKKAGPLAG